MNVCDYLKKTSIDREGVINMRPNIICADGFSISVQAGYGYESMPRWNQCKKSYYAVEACCVSCIEPELEPYRDGIVFKNVPLNIVEKIVAEHGGIENPEGLIKAYEAMKEELMQV